MLGILCTISNHLSLVVPVRGDQEDTYEEKLKHVQNDVEDNGECSTRSINLLKNITQHLRINALFRIPLYIIVQEQSIISILRTITVILFFLWCSTVILALLFLLLLLVFSLLRNVLLCYSGQTNIVHE